MNTQKHIKFSHYYFKSKQKIRTRTYIKPTYIEKKYFFKH